MWEGRGEDQDYGVSVVEQRVAELGGAAGDAAAGQSRVEAMQRLGRVDPQQSVQEADRSAPVCSVGEPSPAAQIRLAQRYLRAGRRPKKAMKVRKEIVKTKRATLRSVPIATAC